MNFFFQPYYELINWLLMYSNHMQIDPKKERKKKTKLKKIWMNFDLKF